MNKNQPHQIFAKVAEIEISKKHHIYLSDSHTRTDLPADTAHCNQAGCEGQVTVIGIEHTLLAIHKFTDASGQVHEHDPNEQWISFQCGKGHTWNKSFYQACRQCGWSRDKTGVRFKESLLVSTLTASASAEIAAVYFQERKLRELVEAVRALIAEAEPIYTEIMADDDDPFDICIYCELIDDRQKHSPGCPWLALTKAYAAYKETESDPDSNLASEAQALKTAQD